MKFYVVAALFAPVIAIVSGCTGTDTIQTSGDTAIIQTRAAPICGSTGAVHMAQKQAAIETLKSGFDSFVIVGAASSNNIHMMQMPGNSTTIGIVSGNYGGGNISGVYNGTTTYLPGPTVVYGHHRQSFSIKMFHKGEPGSQNALSARAALGPDWRKAMKEGPLGVCF